MSSRRLPAIESQGDTSAWFEDSAAGVYHLPQFLDVSLWPAFICYLIQQHSVDAIWQVGSTFMYDLLPQIRQLFPAIPVVDQLFNPVGHTANYLKYRYLIDHVVTEHAGMKDWLLEHGETEERISVIPNGVNLEWFAPRPRLDWRTGQPRPPGDGRFVVGFIGRLSKEKGPDLFLDIASQLADRPDLEFLLCGGGPMEAQLRVRIAAQDLSARVHFLDFILARGGHLPCCDVTVVCSRLDGRPNLVMESLAMGIPVIASRVGALPEMIPEGRGGILCEPGDIPGFARRHPRAGGQSGSLPRLLRGRAKPCGTTFLVRGRRKALRRHLRGSREASSRPIAPDQRDRRGHCPKAAIRANPTRTKIPIAGRLADSVPAVISVDPDGYLEERDVVSGSKT